jgi:hypothetical protein
MAGIRVQGGYAVGTWAAKKPAHTRKTTPDAGVRFSGGCCDGAASPRGKWVTRLGVLGILATVLGLAAYHQTNRQPAAKTEAPAPVTQPQQTQGLTVRGKFMVEKFAEPAAGDDHAGYVMYIKDAKGDTYIVGTTMMSEADWQRTPESHLAKLLHASHRHHGVPVEAADVALEDNGEKQVVQFGSYRLEGYVLDIQNVKKIRRLDSIP